MARFSTSNVNPDLAKERQTRTFDPEILTRILDGGKWITEKRRQLGEYIILHHVSGLKVGLQFCFQESSMVWSVKSVLTKSRGPLIYYI